MSINEAVGVVRERCRVVLLCFLLGLLGAGAAVALIPNQYAADVPLYVSLSGRAESADDAYNASQVAKERVASYVPLMRDARIMRTVIDRLQLPMTPAQLAKQVTVTVEPDTVVMVERVTDSSPYQAADIANAVAQTFVAVIGELEQPIGPAPAATPVTGSVALGRQPVVTPTPPAPPAEIGPRIIRSAVPSVIPVSPNIPFSVALGAAFGLLIGLGAAFLSHARDRSVRHPERLQTLTSAPVLSEIPADEVVDEVPIAFGQSSESVLAEAYRRLRTNLQFRHGAPRNCAAQVVVVTAPGVGEGTSLTACNLARAMAMSSKVMLIDANFRHPQVELYLGLDPGPGLTTVLTGNLDWQFARRKLEGSGLEVLTSGPVGFQLGELLTWQRMDDLLRELRQRYDFVVIDAPALVAVSDAAAVAARADGAVLVVRYGETREEQVTEAAEALRAVSAPLLGTVLNGVPRRRRFLKRAASYPEQRSTNPFLLGPGKSLVPPDRRSEDEADADGSQRFRPDPASESTR